mmetsp:Transcript_9947/g.26376  ORF Transcript_9947/g.26376 Transcript_9947/m.26376 type:complete len:99 (-) Transcript_9947:936-1232(-)
MRKGAAWLYFPANTQRRHYLLSRQGQTSSWLSNEVGRALRRIHGEYIYSAPVFTIEMVDDVIQQVKSKDTKIRKGDYSELCLYFERATWGRVGKWAIR